MSMSEQTGGRHRATYVLEHGTWRARCKVCGWEVQHEMRRHAAALFRYHIKDTRSAPEVPNVVDLRDLVATTGPNPPLTLSPHGLLAPS
jgi:hypothetical protein